jgi:hypothetical protein
MVALLARVCDEVTAFDRPIRTCTNRTIALWEWHLEPALVKRLGASHLLLLYKKTDTWITRTGEAASRLIVYACIKLTVGIRIRKIIKLALINCVFARPPKVIHIILNAW